MLRLGIRVFGERGATFQCSVYMLAVAGLLRQLEQRAAEEAERAADRAASAAPTVRDQGGLASRAAAGGVAPAGAQEAPATNKRARGASAAFARRQFWRRCAAFGGPTRGLPCAGAMVWHEPDPRVTGAAKAGTTTTTRLPCVRVARRPAPVSVCAADARPRPPRACAG